MLKRRTFFTRMGITAALAAFGAGVSSASVEDDADQSPCAPHMVLLAGSWLGTWAWSRVTPLLSTRGVAAIPLDIVGDGLEARYSASFLRTPFDPEAFAIKPSPHAQVTLDSAVEQLTQQIEAIAIDGSIALVGHSLAGVFLNALGEQRPELIRRLVYLSAFVPTKFPSVQEYFTEPNIASTTTFSLLIGNPSGIGAVRIQPRSTDADYSERLREAFFADLSDEDVVTMAQLQPCDTPASFLGTPVPVTADRWGSIPRAYVRLLQDRSIPLAMADQFIAEADDRFPHPPFDVVDLDASHSPFISRPVELAEILAALAQ